MKKIIPLTFLLYVFTVNTFCQWDTVHINAANVKKYTELSGKLLDRYQLNQSKILADKIYAFDSTSVDGLLQCAEVYAGLNNTLKTISLFRKAIEFDSINTYPYLKLGEFYQKNAAWVEAINCYSPVVNTLDTLNYFALKQTGVCMLELNNPGLFPLALNYLFRAMQVNPYDLSLSFRIANTCNQIRRFDASIEACSKGLLIDSLNTKLLTAMAYAQYNKSDFRNAIANFNKVLAKGDTSSFIIKNLGFAYYRNNQFLQARALLDKSVNLLKVEGQIDYDVYLFLSDISLQMDDSKAAMQYLQKADSLRYPAAEVQSRLYKAQALVFNSDKDWVNGAKYFEMAYNTFTEDKSALLFLAYQYDYLKNKEKAYDLYRQFVSVADPLAFQKDLVIVRQRIARLKEDLFFEGKVKK
jgi:tetratricopeptide (TPR) repeat protein